MRKNIHINNKAFSLLEVTVVIIILTILASAAIPVLSMAYIEKAGNKQPLISVPFRKLPGPITLTIILGRGNLTAIDFSLSKVLI